MYDLFMIRLFHHFSGVNNNRNDKFLIAFGKHLRHIRKSKGLTMETVAFNANMEYRQLGRIERGEVNTTISTTLVLSKALGVEVYKLFQF